MTALEMVKKVNSERWNELYRLKRENGSYNKYPTEHILIFVAKNYYKVRNRGDVRILEIGCGSGANLLFLSQEKFQAYGLDHSAFAIEMAGEFLRKYDSSANLKTGCATSLPYEDSYFDACVESNSIHCNTTQDIQQIFDEIHRVLKPGGKFYGIAVSDSSVEFGTGKKIDERTFDLSETKSFRGQFDGFPVIHFFGREEIIKLAKRFSSCTLELDLTRYETGGNQSPLGYWLIQLEK